MIKSDETNSCVSSVPPYRPEPAIKIYSIHTFGSPLCSLQPNIIQAAKVGIKSCWQVLV